MSLGALVGSFLEYFEQFVLFRERESVKDCEFVVLAVRTEQGHAVSVAFAWLGECAVNGHEGDQLSLLDYLLTTRTLPLGEWLVKLTLGSGSNHSTVSMLSRKSRGVGFIVSVPFQKKF